MTDWWQQHPLEADTVPPAGTTTPTRWGSSGPIRPGSLGANTIAVGAATGVLAPVVGLAVAGAINGLALDDRPELHLGVRTVTIAFLVGAILAGWAPLTAGQIRLGVRNGFTAGSATAVASGALLPVADLLWRASRSDGGPGSLVILVGAWVVIGALAGGVAGIEDGSARSGRGLIGGLVGGLAGGLLFAATSGDFRLTEESSATAQFVGYCATSLGIGLGAGLTERLARTAWLVAVDGPKAGREYILYRDRTTIGRADDCHVYLGPDDQVAGCHAEVRAGVNGLELHPIDGPVEIDGREWPGGPIGPGAVLRIGSTFLRLEQRRPTTNDQEDKP